MCSLILINFCLNTLKTIAGKFSIYQILRNTGKNYIFFSFFFLITSKLYSIFGKTDFFFQIHTENLQKSGVIFTDSTLCVRLVHHKFLFEYQYLMDFLVQPCPGKETAPPILFISRVSLLRTLPARFLYVLFVNK